MAETDTDARCAARGRAAGRVRRAVTLAGALLLTGCGPEWLTGGADGPCPLDGGTTAWQPGCASSHNLAALVDRPADLRMPRRETPRDASRRDTVIATYQDDSRHAATAKAEEPRP